METNKPISFFVNYGRDNYKIYTEDLTLRMNLYSVFWCILNIALYYIAFCFSTRIPFDIPMIVIAGFFLVRFFGVPISILYRAITAYSVNRSLSIARMNYRQIKKLSKVFSDDFEIGMCEIKRPSYYDEESFTRLYIMYDSEDICGSFFTYFMLAIAWYICKVCHRIEVITKLVGSNYRANKEEKQKLNKEVKKSTEEMLNKMIKKIDKMKDESQEYINQGVDILGSCLKNKDK